ncbi:MAG: RNA polymerase sigma factor [Planctomycetota bacterium]
MRTDAELLMAYAARRDGGAFAELVTRHGPMVYRSCRRLLGTDAEVEDAAQAVFVVLARKAGSFRKGADLAGWLYGIAGNVCRWALRDRARRTRHEKEAVMMRAGNDAEMADADREALLECVDRELAALPAAERQAVILRYLEDRPQAEAATIAGCPQGTLAWRASKGLERLRERLARRGTVLGLAAISGVLAAEAHAAVPASLLPSLVSASSLAAVGAAGGTAIVVGAQHSAPLHLAEGVMKAILWAKVKFAAMVTVGAMAVGVGTPAVYKAVAGENLKSADVGAGLKPAPTDANVIAWGETVNGLQAGLVPTTTTWSGGICSECLEKVEGAKGRIYLSIAKPCPKCLKGDTEKFCRGSCAIVKRICIKCGAAKPSGATFTEGEPIGLEYHLRNTGTREMKIADAGVTKWKLLFASKDGGVTRLAGFHPKRNMVGTEWPPISLAGGQHEVFNVAIDNNWQFEDIAKPGSGIETLPPGRYVVTATLERSFKPELFWHGKVTSGAVEIEIAPGGAAVGRKISIDAETGEVTQPGQVPIIN